MHIPLVTSSQCCCLSQPPLLDDSTTRRCRRDSSMDSPITIQDEQACAPLPVRCSTRLPLASPKLSRRIPPSTRETSALSHTHRGIAFRTSLYTAPRASRQQMLVRTWHDLPDAELDTGGRLFTHCAHRTSRENERGGGHAVCMNLSVFGPPATSSVPVSFGHRCFQSWNISSWQFLSAFYICMYVCETSLPPAYRLHAVRYGAACTWKLRGSRARNDPPPPLLACLAVFAAAI